MNANNAYNSQDKEIALNILLKSSDLRDRAFALTSIFENQIGYSNIQFNPWVFKQHAKDPLADRSHDLMDVAKEFKQLTDKINRNDEQSSFYLDARAIVDNPEHQFSSEDNPQEIIDEGQKVLRYLMGKSDRDRPQWVMYEENKEAMLNADEACH